MTFNKSKLIKKIGIFLGIDLVKLRWILQGNPIRLLTKEFYLPIINLNMHPWGKIKKLQKILIKDPFSETNQAKLETVASGIDIDIPQTQHMTMFVKQALLGSARTYIFHRTFWVVTKNFIKVTNFDFNISHAQPPDGAPATVVHIAVKRGQK